jgi:hypothetical protein
LDDNCKSQGSNIQQARIWAHTNNDLNLALSYITERGGKIINNPSLLPVSTAKSTPSRQQSSFLNNLDNSFNTSNEENILNISYAKKLKQGIIEDNKSIVSSSLSSVSSVSPTNSVVKLIVWPHVSCRYILLNDSLKENLNELISQLRSSGLTIVSPYR